MEKREFRTKAHQAVESLISEIERLEAKRDELSDDMKEKYDSQISKLRQRKEELNEQMKALEAKQDKNWQEAKKIVSSSLEHYKAGFIELSKLFKS